MKRHQAHVARRTQFSTKFCVILLLCLVAAIAASAQTYSVVADTSYGYAGFLTRGLDGNFYGTNGNGGTGTGTIYKVTPDGTLTTIYEFPGYPYESDPAPRLLLATDGNFYGTTLVPYGTIFKITPDGTLTTIYTFTCSGGNCGGGYWAQAGLVEGRDGNFYGTTALAGANNGGMMFRISPSGTFTTLYNFCAQSNCADGGTPRQLIQASDGNFYGTTSNGGSHNGGTIFKITPSGVLTVLHNLYRGQCVEWGVLQGSDGNFYGTTYGGGVNGRGTVFKMTPTGSMTTLYSFCSQTDCADGDRPYAGLVEGTDGNFYGTTLYGGVNGIYWGTIFSVTPAGEHTLLYSFCSSGKGCHDGNAPESTMIQAPSGSFYGTTVNGGAGNSGVAFSLGVGLAPFVEMLPASGKAGQSVKILGQGLTGTTAVSFNGTATSFTVKADTYLTAIIPAGATSGYVTVQTGAGILKSNFVFQVRP